MKHLLSATFATFVALALSVTTFAATSAPSLQASNSTRTIETGFPKGAVIAQLNNMSNYPNQPSWLPEEDSFSKFTVLHDGTAVLETKTGTTRHTISKANLESIELLALRVSAAQLESGRHQIVCMAMPPATRLHLAVATRDYRSEKWSDDVNLVWMESGCMYGSYLYPANDHDRALAQELAARLETIARELMN